MGLLQLAIVLAITACGSSAPGRPSVATAPAPATVPPTTAANDCGATGATEDVDRALAALASRGQALIDHIGPDATAAIEADLARRPGVYLDRFECLYVRPAPSRAYASLFLVLPMWRLRVHDPDRVRALAASVGRHYDELARLPVDPADPDLAHRLAEQARSMALVRDGVDLAPGTTWKLVAPP